MGPFKRPLRNRSPHPRQRVEVKKREGKDDSSPALLSSPNKKLRGCFYTSISKTVMNYVSSVPIDDCENTLSFPSEETSLGSGLPSHLPMGDVPCPSSPSHGFLHHTIGTLNNALWIHTITVLGIRIVFYTFLD